MLSSPLLRGGCKSRGGVSKFWVGDPSEISLTIDPATEEVAGFTGNGVFVLIDPEKNTSSFNQKKTINKSSVNVEQIVNFIIPNQTAVKRKQLRELDDGCAYIVIAKLNNGELAVAGISYFPTSNTYEVEEMRVSEGDANSGTASTDSNEYNTRMKCNTNTYALHLQGADESLIPV